MYFDMLANKVLSERNKQDRKKTRLNDTSVMLDGFWVARLVFLVPTRFFHDVLQARRQLLGVFKMPRHYLKNFASIRQG